MNLKKKQAALTVERQRVTELHQRAVQAANQAQIGLLQIDAQLALLAELLAPNPPKET